MGRHGVLEISIPKKPEVSGFASEITAIFWQLCHLRDWDGKYPKALRYGDFTAVLDEHEFEGEERSTALQMLLAMEQAFRSAKIDEANLSA